MRCWLCCILVVIYYSRPVVAVVGGDPAFPPEPDAAVIFVQKHGRSARLEGLKNDNFGYYTFYGIRYAEPPVGVRRFQRPVRRYLAGEITAFTPCSVCPQLDTNFQKVIGHEDCLCLNVFSPKMPGEERGSPVVVFIHGGNYRTGSASPYGGRHLTQQDTILVVPQYRLGSLGFITNGRKEASGNAGLFDLLVVMDWVRDYIEFFGGDPKRVVVMGQGSGGSAASLMALSSEGRSATGVAALSGTPLSPGAVRSNPEEHAKELANRTNCPWTPVERFILCLRKLPVEKIIEADKNMDVNMNADKFLAEISGRSGTGARVEGENDNRGLPTMVQDKPGNSMKKRMQRSPLLTGVTSAETSRAVYGKYSQFLNEQLRKGSDFIKKDIIGGLQTVVTNIDGLLPVPAGDLKSLIPLADYYQIFFDNSITAVDGLTKIVEATSDALFNFPAFQSVREWSTGAPSFLYSFEFVGNLTKGAHFLPGVALAGNSDAEAVEAGMKGPAHGDDLAYIFDPLDEEGKSIESSEVASSDAQVRKAFVGLIAKFARDLIPLGKKNGTDLLGLVPFSKDGKDDQYIKINNTISLGKNFRFCQMGLWGNMADRLTGNLCKSFFQELLKLPNLNTAATLLKPITSNETLIPSLLNLNPSVQQVPKNTNQKKIPSVVKPFGFGIGFM